MPEENLLLEQTRPENHIKSGKPGMRLLRGEKIGPAFWTITSIISLIVNIILIVVMILLAQQLFGLKSVVQNQLLGGLYANFVQMDQAHIRTTIPVSAQVPARFDLPLSTATIVTLTEDTVVPHAVIYDFDAGNLRITQATTNIILPAGLQLPVQLNLTVPVDQQIPVNLLVEVDIPLNQTELHQPFVGLQKVILPYYSLMNKLPNTWQETLCGPEPSQSCQEMIR